MSHAAIALLLAAIALALLASRRVRIDVVGALLVLGLVLTGLVPSAQALTGLSDPAVLTVAALAALGAALRASGLFERLADLLSPILRWPALRGPALGLVAAIASAFGARAPALAALLPIARQTARREPGAAATAQRVVLGATAAGGLVTTLGTLPNILVSSQREHLVGHGFSLFDPARLGLPIAAIALAVVILAAARLRWTAPAAAAPTIATTVVPASAPPLSEPQQVEGVVSEVFVPPGSTLVGQTLERLQAEANGALTVQAIIREDHRRIAPRPGWPIAANDVLVLACTPNALQRLIERANLTLAGAAADWRDGAGVVEAVLTPGSDWLGRSFDETGVGRRYGVGLLALGRSTQAIARLRRTKLRAGDVLVLQGPREALPAAAAALGCLTLAERRLRLGRKRQGALPMAAMAGAAALAAYGVLPLSLALLAGVLALLVLRALAPEDAYAAIPWPVLVLLAGLLPLSAALTDTGAAALVSDRLAEFGLPALGIAAALLLAACGLATLATGAASALVLVPLAAPLATRLGFDPDPLFLAIALGASAQLLPLPARDRLLAATVEAGLPQTDLVRLGRLLAATVLIAGLAALLLRGPA